ncbi:uncharacterized protein LOC121265863 [Juglans microcarpa x Juglans regia]|uniref:uncharacterized protein LOC121265863 n=1 Tax=Juglans microcarpa x Juglans regia TaxID=2249226 RepID=UPI001B7EAB2B|nr:uncharacterized protein LOC121265863 [Juglans microcarpa x Juglans regia]
MDPKIYKAAAKGNLQDVLEHGSRDQLDKFLTVNKNTILHICILSILVEEKFPATGGTDPVSAARFVEDVLNRCPSLLLKANAKGDTPLHVAARYGHASIVKVLIEHQKPQHQDLESGGVVEATREMIRKQNKGGETALHEAVRENHIDVVKQLLMEVGPGFSFGANAAGETPLYLAAKGHFPDLVSEILNNLNSPASDGPFGTTALHAAAFRDDEGMSNKILERYGRDLCKQADQNGWTPLHMAAYMDNFKPAKLLLESDREVAYKKDAEGRTALHIAALRNNSLVTEVIISMCPDCCEVVDNEGRNALHLAVMTKLRPDVALIIQDNSSLQNLLNQKDNEGNTPLHLYCNSDGYHERVLTSPRVDKMVFNKENQTAYQILRSKGFQTGDDQFKKMKNIFEDTEDYRFFNYGRALEVGYADINMKEPNGEDVKLKQEREKKMEEEDKAAQVHLVAAALITTVTFAAGINMPGGFIGGDDHPHPGSAVLEKSVAFKVFIITNALALMLSSSAVFIHLFIPLMPSEDLFKTRTCFLQLAFWFLLSSMAPMVLAFVTAYRGAIIAMDPKIYKEAVKGNLEVLEHDISHPLDGFLTVNQITILHICISSILVEEEFRNQVSSLMGLEHDISHPRAALMIQDNSSLRNLLNQKDNHGNTPLHHYSKCFWYHERLLNSPRVDKMVFNKENQNAYQILTSKSFPTDDDDDKFTNLESEDFEQCLVGMERKVTPEMNEALSMDFSRVEVEEALKQMAPLKAAGPNGAKLEEWNRIKEVLNTYEMASGQFLNKDKTSVFFSSNTREGDKKMIMEVSKSIAYGSYERYLGLPAFEDAKVEQLIDKHKGEWNEGRIREIFLEEEVAQILKRLKNERGDCLVGAVIDERWRNIWNLEVPSVTKLFLWRAGNNRLPTKENLFKRKVVEDKSCLVCSVETETIMHALWVCPAANDIWAEVGGCVQKWGRTEEEFLLLWGKLMGRLSMKKLEDMVVLLRRVWLHRNEFVFEKKLGCPKILVKTTLESLLEFKAAQILTKQVVKGQNNNARSAMSWEKLESGCAKVNRDASLNLKERRMRAGIIVRVPKVEALVAICDQKANVDSSVVA